MFHIDGTYDVVEIPSRTKILTQLPSAILFNNCFSDFPDNDWDGVARDPESKGEAVIAVPSCQIAKIKYRFQVFAPIGVLLGQPVS